MLVEALLAMAIMSAITLIAAVYAGGAGADWGINWTDVWQRPSAHAQLRRMIDSVLRDAEPRPLSDVKIESIVTAAIALTPTQRIGAHDHASNLLGNPVVQERLLKAVPTALRRARRRNALPELSWLRAKASEVSAGDSDFEIALTLAMWDTFLGDDERRAHELTGLLSQELLLSAPSTDPGSPQ